MNILPFDKQIAVIAALSEGMSIRSTERLTQVHRDTIMRLGVRVGQGCDRLHNHIMRNLQCSIIQIDELWSFIGKKQRRVTADDDATKGDAYTFLAMDAHEKAILSYRAGKRDAHNTQLFVDDLRSRVLGAPVIYSDAFGPYKEAIRWGFGDRVHYGQIIKKVQGAPIPDGDRRYSPRDIVTIDRRPIFGRPNPEAICTSHIERQNLSLRMAQRRFTRLTNGFSKKLENHAAAVGLFVSHNNLCRIHETIKTTPAIAVGVTYHVWSISCDQWRAR